MKRFLFTTILFTAALAKADTLTGHIHGLLALRVYDNIERTGVEPGLWTDNQGVKHYDIQARKVICDYNTHYDPIPTQCIVMDGFLNPPHVVTGLKARNLESALRDAALVLEPQGLFIGDCAMGRCSEETANVSCLFADNDTENASCEVTQGNPF